MIMPPYTLLCPFMESNFSRPRGNMKIGFYECYVVATQKNYLFVGYHTMSRLRMKEKLPLIILEIGLSSI